MDGETVTAVHTVRFLLLSSALTGTGTIALDATFGSFYLIRISFTLGELVSLVKVFRMFRLEGTFFGVQSVDAVGRCTTSYLLTGPACLWCLVVFSSSFFPSVFFFFWVLLVLFKWGFSLKEKTFSLLLLPFTTCMEFFLILMRGKISSSSSSCMLWNT